MPTRSCREEGLVNDRSQANKIQSVILQVLSTQEPQSLAIGTIPVDPSDDAGDGGGISKRVRPASQPKDPKSHTPVDASLVVGHRNHHLPSKKNRGRCCG